MKNAFGGLISRLHMVEERSSELKDIQIDASKTEIQREEILEGKKWNRIAKNCETITKDVT